MAKNEGARKAGKFLVVCLVPDVCKTQVGPAVVPIPYPITSNLSDSMSTSTNVNLGGDPAFILNKSTVSKVTGDEPGLIGGVMSGTNRAKVKPIIGSSSVKINKKPIVRHGDLCDMNNGNTKGKVVFQGVSKTASGSNSNPPIKPDTPQEEVAKEEKKGLWSRMSEGVHTTLDLAGFIPGLGAIPDLANAAIYALEGNAPMAALSAVAAVPGVGDSIKAGSMVVKGGKTIVKQAGKKAAKEVVEAGVKKTEKEIVEKVIEKKAAKKTVEKAAKKKVEKKVAEKKTKSEAAEGAAEKKGKDGGKVKGKKGPCDHLKKGNGKGPYRGGAHSGTSKPANDGLDSHHMPAKDSSPLSPNDGPAIQMEPQDHARTSSNGQMPGSIEYREIIADMIDAGKWKNAIVTEIKDVRRVAREAGEPKKYNQAMKEMVAYMKCLVKHGLL